MIGLLHVRADAGYIVTIGNDPDGRIVASARDGAGETWQVRAALRSTGLRSARRRSLNQRVSDQQDK